jgi:WD40 repeat protein
LQDGRLQIRQLNDGAVLESVDGYESPILKMTVSPDSQWVGVAYVDEVKIYGREDGAAVYRFPAATAVAFEPDSQRFAVGYLNGRIELWDLTNGSFISDLPAHRDKVSALAFLPSGELLSAGFDCNLSRWQIPDMTSLGSLENVLGDDEPFGFGELYPLRVQDFLVMPDGQSVIGLFLGGDFGVWSVEVGRLLRTPDADDTTTISAVASDGRLLAVSHGIPEAWDSSITFVETESGPAAFSPDSTVIVGRQREYPGSLLLWQVTSMRSLYISRARTNTVTAVTFTPDGRLIFSSGLDGLVWLWGIP